MEKIAILGAGVMGSAVTWPLTDNGYDVHLIGTHLDDAIISSCKSKRYHPRLERKIPDRVTPFFIDDLDQALEDVSFIVSGVNSMGVNWIGKKLAPYVKKSTRIIAITKGLEVDGEGNLVILPEVMRSELPENVRDAVSIAAVGGPCIAGELAGRRQSCVYFGARELETVVDLKKFFKTDYYHVWTTDDIVSLELAVALKNAYAFGVGIADGILERAGGVDSSGAYMHNLKAALFARGCLEMHTLLAAQGANGAFAYNLPGVGDLFVTSTGGRSVTLGRLIGAGLNYEDASARLSGETLEAALVIQQMGKALPALYRKNVIEMGDVPFMDLLVDIVVHNKLAELNLDAFFGI